MASNVQLLNETLFSARYLEKVEKFVVVIRNPFYSSLADFVRQFNFHTTSFNDVNSFVQKANRTLNGMPHFVDNLLWQSRMGFRFLDAIIATKKPLLVLTYEDMQRDIQVQLIRMAAFLGVGANEQVLQRSECTALQQSIDATKTKRKYSVDLKAAARKFINDTLLLEVVHTYNQKVTSAKVSFLDVKDYLRATRDEIVTNPQTSSE